MLPKSITLPDYTGEHSRYLQVGQQKIQIFLRFEKVASASFVWVNGHEVGYNEGAQEPAEYNITPYLKPGENTLAVCVLKYSDGYYLEGQDYWRLAGIFDDVWLYATPAVRIFDWQVITEFDNTYTDSQLSIQVKIKDYQKKPNENYGLKAYLKDKNGKIICNFPQLHLKWTLRKRQYSCIPWYKNPGNGQPRHPSFIRSVWNYPIRPVCRKTR